MDGLSPDVSAASTETTSAPLEVAVSATAAQPEAVLAGQDTAQAPELQASETATDAPVELPDEQTFEQLAGPERGQNWKQARARIAELNEKVNGFTAYQPVIEQIEQLGGWDRIQQHAEVGSLLFAQVEDPQTGQVRLTAEPLIERLASESPNTLGELVWKGIHQPSPWNPDETIAHAFLRDYLGLDPSLLDTYRQIQNPADAQKYFAPGQITPEELANIPPQFHDAYKSLSPKQREDFPYLDEATKSEWLQDKTDALQARQFIAAQNAEKEQQKQQAAELFQSRVEQRGRELGLEARNVALASARDKLKSDAVFSADAEVNEAFHSEAIQWAAGQLLADPASAHDDDRADKLYELAAEAELRGDKMQSSQYKLQADALAKKLEGRFLNMLTKRTAFWSKALGGARQVQQQQVEQARPRAEIASSNQSPGQNPRSQTVGHGFAPTPQRLAQYEQMLRAAQMQNG